MPKRFTKDDFIKKAVEVHGYKYDYSFVEYVNANTKVKLICPIHGEFYVRPNDHIHSRIGCHKCSGVYQSNKDDFIEKARKIHGDKYDYSKVEYKNNKTKVCIICPKHRRIFAEAKSTFVWVRV